jgi:hypothetical protein
MVVLITLKSIRLNGDIVQPGIMIRVEDEQGLVDKGHARRLTPEEACSILSEYVEYAQKLFGEVRKVLPAKFKQEDCPLYPYHIGISPKANEGCSHPKATLESRRSDVSAGVTKS